MSSPSEPPPRTSSLRVKSPRRRDASAGDDPADAPPAAAPTTRPVDEYDARYMGGASLARSKKPMPRWFHAVLLLGFLAVVVSAIATRQLASIVTAPLLVLVWLLFTHLRLTVTTDKVYVQLGLFGPTIPLEQIESARAERYNPLKYGGWGVRFGLDGSRAYSVPGGTGMAVRIEYRTSAGGRRVVLVSSDEAEHIAATIEQARAARDGGVRVLAEQSVAVAESAEGASAERGDEAQRDRHSR